MLGFDLCAASDASPAPLHDSLLAPTYLTSPSFPFSMAFLALDHLKLVLICGSVPRFYPRQSLCLSLPPPFSQADSSTPAQRLCSVPRGFPCVSSSLPCKRLHVDSESFLPPFPCLSIRIQLPITMLPLRVFSLPDANTHDSEITCQCLSLFLNNVPNKLGLGWQVSFAF